MSDSAPPRPTARGRERTEGDRFDRRRAELAAAAMRTLSELGYARTSLREIAQNSQYSHGVLHYYFADKNDLISACIRMYRTESLRRNDTIVDTSATAEDLRRTLADNMRATLVEDTAMHRLWYDLRWQSTFEAALREDVISIDDTLRTMMYRIVQGYAVLAGMEPIVGPAHAYGVFDGLFHHALLRHQAGDPSAATDLHEQVGATLDHLVG